GYRGEQKACNKRKQGSYDHGRPIQATTYGQMCNIDHLREYQKNGNGKGHDAPEYIVDGHIFFGSHASISFPRSRFFHGLPRGLYPGFQWLSQGDQRPDTAHNHRAYAHIAYLLAPDFQSGGIAGGIA